MLLVRHASNFAGRINSISHSIPRPPASSTMKPCHKKERKRPISAACVDLTSARCASQKTFVATPQNNIWPRGKRFSMVWNKKLLSLLRLATFIKKCDAHLHEHGFERERPGR